MSQPQIQRISRKFGKFDSWKYENIFVDSSLAVKSIERVTIDCRFRFERSKWGVLTKARHPGGIIYLDLNFHQPGDHCLKHATVTITLDDDSDDLIRHLPTPDPLENAKMPIHISDHGPTQIMGAAKSAHKVVEHQAAPEVGVGGYINVGNMGRTSEKDFNQEYRWTFFSQKKPAKKDSPHYKVLKWTINENELDPHSYHSNTIHTAFAFRHGYQPFLIRVTIDGRLRSRWSNLRQRFSSLKDQRFATTLVNFNGDEKFTRVLDQIAQGLPYEMEKENVLKAPAEAEGPQKPTYSSPLQEPEAPQEMEQVPLVNDSNEDDGTIGEQANKGGPDNKYPTSKDVADVFKSLSGSYKPSIGQDGVTPLPSHIQLSKPKDGVVDELTMADQRSTQENSKPVASEQEKDQNDPTQLQNVLLDHQETRYRLQIDLSDVTKTLKAHWKPLLQYTLQLLGLISIVSVVVKRLTLDGRASVSVTAIRSTSSTAEGS